MVGIVSVGGLDASRFQYQKVSYFVTGELVARFDVLVAALLKTEIIWDATVCSRVSSSGCFRGSCLQL
jgi:hypothetical protein